MKISKKDREIILQKAREIPPLSWLPNSATEDQIQEWFSTKVKYSNLHDELLAYFSGKASPLPERLPPEIAALLDLQAKLYLDLYNVLRDGWHIIKAISEDLSTDSKLEKSDRYAIEVVRNADSPGQLLAKIIELECEEEFDRCKRYTEVRPRKTYDLVRRHQKVQILKHKDGLTASEAKQIHDHEKNLEKITKPRRGGSATISGLCLGACSAYLRHYKNESLRISVKRYESRCNEHRLSLYPYFHPRKAPKPFAWVNGRITPLRS